MKTAGLVGVLVGVLLWTPAAPARAQDPSPAAAPSQTLRTRTPVKNFVFLFQENHSFDNYFGTRPGVDGFPKGVCMPRTPGTTTPCVKPFHIGDGGITDLDHTGGAFRDQIRDGKMDGFFAAQNRRGKDGALAMGYYDDRDLPYYWNIADEYVLFDRFFSSSNSGSIRNHMYAVTGHPGALGDRETIPEAGWGNLPTIFDRLEAAGVSWKFYVENYDPTITFRGRKTEDVDRGAQVIWVPLLAYARYVDDPKLSSHIVGMDQYFEDAARGDLPAVSFVAPSGDSEHPPGSIQAGQRLVRTLVTALMRSSQWPSSAFLWSYDDWGGWYDHVPPPKVDEHGYGFRVPALLVSPYARRGHVEHSTNDFTSILKFIEVNWGVPPLTARDRAANPMLGAFDFAQRPRPPELLPATRRGERPGPLHTAPVYVSYGLVVIAVAGLFGAIPAVERMRTRPRRPSRGRWPARGRWPWRRRSRGRQLWVRRYPSRGQR